MSKIKQAVIVLGIPVSACTIVIPQGPQDVSGGAKSGSPEPQPSSMASPIPLPPPTLGTSIEDYFPLVKGLKRESISYYNGIKLGTIVVSILLVQEQNGKKVASVRQDLFAVDGSGGAFSYTAVYEGLELRIERDGDTSPYVMLKGPPTVGTSWKDEEFDHKISAFEDVAVKGGIFKQCLVIERTGLNGGTKKQWYAKGLGEVKYVGVYPNGDRETIELSDYLR